MSQAFRGKLAKCKIKVRQEWLIDTGGLQPALLNCIQTTTLPVWPRQVCNGLVARWTIMHQVRLDYCYSLRLNSISPHAMVQIFACFFIWREATSPLPLSRTCSILSSARCVLSSATILQLHSSDLWSRCQSWGRSAWLSLRKKPFQVNLILLFTYALFASI